MFKVVREPIFTHDVKVFTPIDGGHREETVKVTYRVIPTDEAAAFGNSEQGNREFLQRVVMKLDELVDEETHPVPYSDELRDQLLRQPHVRLALVRGYHDGVAKARPGN